MPLPVRHLPVLQNWDCHGCGTCCHEYHVFVSDEERQKIAAQGWEKDSVIGDLPLFVRDGPPWSPRYRLNQQAGGACIFLSEAGRCRIHERFGSQAKPLPCQLYPFVLIPAANHWRVGLRYSCPSAAQNKGRSLEDHRKELDQYASELEKQAGRDLSTLPAPVLARGQSIEWADLLRFTHAFTTVLQDKSARFERRMRKLHGLVDLCRQARFEQIKGGRLVEFLGLISTSVDADVPEDITLVPEPTWVGRVLFRQALAVYCRTDRGPQRGEVRSRSALLGAAWRFARGKGRVPRLHGWLPETTFGQAEEPAGPLPDAAEDLLERFYVTKVSSLQFCGPTFYDFPFWEGLQALCLTFPVILWLSRALHHVPKVEAVTRAVSMVDYNYGYNPILGGRRQRLSLGILAQRRELEKLLAWYSR